MKIYIPFILCFAIFVQYAGTQTKYVIDKDNPIKISVHGTSTLHEWTATAHKISDYPDQMELSLEAGAEVDDFQFSVVSTSLDGGRGSSMNNKIQKALLADTHKQIMYKQNGKAQILTNEDGQFYLVSKGILTLAGVEKEINVDVNIEENEGKLVLTAVKAFTMSEFNIEPPTAMFGQIKTNDDISIQFEFTYQAE